LALLAVKAECIKQLTSLNISGYPSSAKFTTMLRLPLQAHGAPKSSKRGYLLIESGLHTSYIFFHFCQIGNDLDTNVLLRKLVLDVTGTLKISSHPINYQFYCFNFVGVDYLFDM